MNKKHRHDWNRACEATRWSVRGAGRGGGSLLAMAVALCAQAWHPPASAQIQIHQPATRGQISVQSNAQVFANGFRLSVDRAVLSDALLEQYVKSLHLSVGGQPVQAFVPVAEGNMLVASSRYGAVLSVTHIEPTAAGLNIFTEARDARGRTIRLHPEEVGLFTWKGAPVCFALQDVEEVDTRLLFDILIDRSGSMGPHMSMVKEAVARFFDHLPANARCRVTSFNEAYRRHTPTYGPCTAQAQGLERLTAQGNTDIFGALAGVYDDHQVAGQHQRAVVVVTDGVGRSPLTKATVAAKKNAVTFVYWLGDYDEHRLTGLADASIYGRDDAEATLGRYFHSIGKAVRAQQVVVSGGSCSSHAWRAK